MASPFEPADPSDLARLVRGEQTDEVIDLEDAVAVAAFGDAPEIFTRLQRRTLAAWVAAFGGVDAPAPRGLALRRILDSVRDAVRRILTLLAPRARRALEVALAAAVALGSRQHADFLSRATGRRYRPFPTRPSIELRAHAAAIADVVTARRDLALDRLGARDVHRWSDVATGIGTAQGALAAVRSRIADTVGRAVNEAGETAIRAAGAEKVWVAERSACVTCAAYAGLAAPVGVAFPAGLSWDPNQRGRGEAVDAPPKHPNCRCRVVPWISSWRPPGVPSMPEVLRREAERSIARGWSTSTESRAARLRAAAELLRIGSNLPSSVQRRAADAVRAGRFTDRAVPTGS